MTKEERVGETYNAAYGQLNGSDGRHLHTNIIYMLNWHAFTIFTYLQQINLTLSLKILGRNLSGVYLCSIKQTNLHVDREWRSFNLCHVCILYKYNTDNTPKKGFYF